MSAPMLRHVFRVFRLFQNNANLPFDMGNRCYSKYLRRKALRVLTKEESENFHDKKKHGNNWPRPGSCRSDSDTDGSGNRLPSSATSLTHQAFRMPLEPEVTVDEYSHKHVQHSEFPENITEEDWQDRETEKFRLPEHIKYVHLKEGDKQLGQVVMTARSRVTREKKGLIILEGHRIIKDAISSGVKVKAIYFTKVEHLRGIPVEMEGLNLFKISYSQLRLWSDMVTPPGVFAICKLPKVGEIVLDRKQLMPLTLICDNIRDPGNMGTLLRSAAAVGCQRILVPKGNVDVWEPKVLRAGAGSHFRTHILNNLGWEVIGNFLSPTTSIYLADNKLPATISKRKLRNIMEKITAVEPETYTERNEETGEVLDVDHTFLRKKALLELYKDVPLSSDCYSNVDYATGDVALVVGGETHGLSCEACKMAFDKNGLKINIPMYSGIDSLNSATAASVIMFEMKRQILAQKEDNDEEEQSEQ